MRRWLEEIVRWLGTVSTSVCAIFLTIKRDDAVNAWNSWFPFPRNYIALVVGGILALSSLVLWIRKMRKQPMDEIPDAIRPQSKPRHNPNADPPEVDPTKDYVAEVHSSENVKLTIIADGHESVLLVKDSKDVTSDVTSHRVRQAPPEKIENAQQRQATDGPLPAYRYRPKGAVHFSGVEDGDASNIRTHNLDVAFEAENSKRIKVSEVQATRDRDKPAAQKEEGYASDSKQEVREEEDRSR
jgi:hypothetical protein